MHSKTVVKIKYNKYLPKTDIFINGNEVSPTSKLYKYKEAKLETVLNNIKDLIIEEINDDEFVLEFEGEKLFFDDVKKAFETNQSVDVIFVENQYKETKSSTYKKTEKQKDSRLDKLKNLVEFMQNGPIEELKDEQIKKNYQRAIDSEFEIAVVATMSSGKSTLINSMLASDIIPAKNEACTAKISKIKNVDKENFSVSVYDKNNNIIETYQNVTQEKLTELNDRKDVFMTCIEGRITNINDDSMNLILIDTPGPNNSQDASHAEKTMEVIKNDEYKPVVLYIMNATQLGTNDDKHLLGIIRDEMQGKDKQSKDRFIFVLNKIDQIDAEKECVESVINNARKYLESNGIMEPNIYPTSAYIAKNIRNYLKGNELTSREKRNLFNDAYYFNETKELHLLKYTPLSDDIKEQISCELEEFKKLDSDEGELMQALYHSGIPYIEAAINEYLEKYAVGFKIQQAIDSFRGVINKNNIEQKLVEDIEAVVSEMEENKSVLESSQESINIEIQKIKNNEQLIDLKSLELSTTTEEINNTNKELKKSKQDLKTFNKQQNEIKKQIVILEKRISKQEEQAKLLNDIIQNKSSDKLKSKIEQINFDPYLSSRKLLAKVTHLIKENITDKYRNEKIRPNEIERMLDNIKYELDIICADIKTDIAMARKIDISAITTKLMDEYKKEIEGLFVDNKGIKINNTVKEFVLSSLPDKNTVFFDYKYTENVKTGTKMIKNPERKIWNPISLFKPILVKVDKYEKQDFIDMESFYGDYIFQIKMDLHEYIKNEFNDCEQEIEDIKENFKSRIEKFDSILERKSREYNDLIQKTKTQAKKKLEEQRKLQEVIEQRKEVIQNQEKLRKEYNELKNKQICLGNDKKSYEQEIQRINNEIKKQEKELADLNKSIEIIQQKQDQLECKKLFLNEVNDRLNEIVAD